MHCQLKVLDYTPYNKFFKKDIFHEFCGLISTHEKFPHKISMKF